MDFSLSMTGVISLKKVYQVSLMFKPLTHETNWHKNVQKGRYQSICIITFRNFKLTQL